MSSMDWNIRPLPHTTNLHVGPCAWRGTMLNQGRRDYLAQHPSLLVFTPADSVSDLQAAGEVLRTLPEKEFPVLVGIQEPEFTRTLPGLIEARLKALGRKSIDVLTLWVQDPAELKAGGSLHTLMKLREQGVIHHLGLAHAEVRSAEWLAINMAVRVLHLPYSLHDQAARHRAIGAAFESEMACLSHDSTDVRDEQALRFALGDASRVLPVVASPIPENLTPMSPEEIEQAWASYQQSHPAPAPLPRSRPPEE